MRDGDECYTYQNFGHAMEHYLQAMRICTTHQFTQSAAELHIKLANLSLKFESYEEADEHARKSIQLNSHDARVSHC